MSFYSILRTIPQSSTGNEFNIKFVPRFTILENNKVVATGRYKTPPARRVITYLPGLNAITATIPQIILVISVLASCSPFYTLCTQLAMAKSMPAESKGAPTLKCVAAQSDGNPDESRE